MATNIPISEDRYPKTLRLSHTRMIYRNFSGKENEFNSRGERNFGAVVSLPYAEALEAYHVKVKTLHPRPDVPGDAETKWIKVRINYNFRKKPTICLIEADPESPYDHTKMFKTFLTEETVGRIDKIPSKLISDVDMNIRFIHYPETQQHPASIVNYLQSLYITIIDDSIDRKYHDIQVKRPIVGSPYLF